MRALSATAAGVTAPPREQVGDVALGPRRPLSALDLQIFRMLQEDGRLPYVQIARRLGVDETRVRRRSERLIADDVFAVTAIANPRLLGLDYMAWLGVAAIPAQAVRIAEALVSLSEVKFVAQCSGRLNIVGEVACVSALDLQRLLDRVRTLPGVDRVEAAVYLDVFQQRFQWLVADEPGDGPLGVRSDEGGADELDAALIRELRRDGRASFREIGKRLDVPSRLVSRRFQELTDRRVVQVIAVANPLDLGFSAMAWLGIRLDPGTDTASVARRLATVAGLDYLVVPAGTWDLMAELVCHDQREMTQTLATRIGEMEGVRLIETFAYTGMLYGSTTAGWGVGRFVGDERVTLG